MRGDLRSFYILLYCFHSSQEDNHAALHISSFKTIKIVKHFTKCHLNIWPLPCADGIPVTIPTGLWHVGACPSLGSIWPLPPALGWTGLVARCWGATAESEGLGSCHYCCCLSFLQAPPRSPSYSPIHLGTDIFTMAGGELPGRLAASLHQPITRPLHGLYTGLTVPYIRQRGQQRVDWQI